ncbi:MAG: response regulator, partial [Blastocatellia bacterium]
MDGRQLTVLIADDAPEDRATLRDVLSRAPAARYVIIEAESGARALELCRARSPDCLVLGYDLPDLSGLELLKRLAAEDGLPACPVVMLVGAGDAQLAVEAMKSGAHDCLEKDRANGETLLRAVSYAIEKADQQRQIAACERGLIEKNRAIEADLAALQREAAGRNQGEEAQQVARAGVSAGRAVASRSQSADQKRAEDRLRLVNAAIEQSSESVIITTAQLDPPGPQIVYVNPAFAKMTGYTPEDVIGKTPRILQGPKTDRSVLNRLRKDCRAGKIFHGEVINYRKDGSEYRLEWSVGPVRNERGEI